MLQEVLGGLGRLWKALGGLFKEALDGFDMLLQVLALASALGSF